MHVIIDTVTLAIDTENLPGPSGLIQKFFFFFFGKIGVMKRWLSASGTQVHRGSVTFQGVAFTVAQDTGIQVACGWAGQGLPKGGFHWPVLRVVSIHDVFNYIVLARAQWWGHTNCTGYKEMQFDFVPRIKRIWIRSTISHSATLWGILVSFLHFTDEKSIVR